VDSLATDRGYTDTPGGHSTAGATYMVLSMLSWVRTLQAGPVRAARDGDVEALRAWLAGGGAPNLRDRDGWTPLLAAASHGRAAAVDLLLHPGTGDAPPADPELRYEAADALPVYLAAHAGDLETVRLLLAAAPDHLHERSSVNGHTALLQAAFYGKQRHLVLAEFLLDNAAAIRGLAPDELPEEQVRLLSATNVRGYNALDMQDLWHNQAMKTLLLRYHGGSPDSERGREIERRRTAYLRALLLSIATPQALTEQVLAAVGDYLAADDPTAAGQRIGEILAIPGFDIDRLGGELGMPPLVYAITGVDVGNPARADRRHALAEKLLAAGADPAVRERHPMAVGAVIRASVLNNFGLLQLLAAHMTPAAFAAEMNVSPAVNGLTAMHDAIHRALTSPPAELDGHVAQITWMIQRGARLDLPDNTGQTQSDLVAAALDDPAFPAENVAAVAAAVAAAQASTPDAPAS
jgi:ankyrin repeat protein